MTDTADAITVRVGNASDWQAIIDQSYLVRMENNFDPSEIRPEWGELSHDFIAEAASSGHFGCVVAEHKGVIVGSVAGQMTNGLSPNVLAPYNRRLGYIWHVYVDPAQRGHRIAQRMMVDALAHFQSLGCRGVRLHTSVSGKSTYLSLGFEPTSELEYIFQNPASTK
jgi:ribosomal protein S18 acetylase RimI-like enzyme